MDDLRTKYERARRAKNQANYRAREERRNAEACRLATDYMRRRASEANAQTTAAEREARAAREAVALKDRAIHRQLQRITELERQLDIARAMLATYERRDTASHDATPMTQGHACECAQQAREATERAIAKIEPHARPWWRRVFEWPKSDGGR